MKVLVTGAGGFLGVHVIERLLAHGHTNIRCLLRDPDKADRLTKISGLYPDARLEFCYGDLRSKADCARALADVSLIFHLAAGLKGSAAEMFADSAVASRNLLETLETRNESLVRATRFVLVSSFGVYGVAIVFAGTHPDFAGQVYNVHDDDLLTASQYLREYKKHVERIPSVRLPYFMTALLARFLEVYHRRSQGRLPLIITRYKTASAWGRQSV